MTETKAMPMILSQTVGSTNIAIAAIGTWTGLILHSNSEGYGRGGQAARACEGCVHIFQGGRSIEQFDRSQDTRVGQSSIRLSGVHMSTHTHRHFH